ncbi:MAG: 5-formyltetrahydrofolate cyclo-ligase, partial [Rhodococcus sp.]|nr:5-formyltetrahydrofolate cyclo-ligase [Rhodococcus sp. (in: high G+C Gram-positive bacteria)]
AVPGATVCAYVPTRLEPGTSDLLVALREVAGRVLLPVTGEEGPMKWAEYTGDADLVPAAHGLREPPGPAFEVDEVQTAHTIFVPALAVDRRGVRLGRGAGYYDRSLVLARPGARLITIVRDSEFVDELPEEPHDVRIGWAVTPSAGLRQLSGE